MSESALTTRIKQARRAVGDDGHSQHVIKTVHGAGYRFVALLDESSDVDAARPVPRLPTSSGEYAWGGAASTEFWCDPRGDIAVVFLSHLRPGSTYPIPTQLKHLVSQALVD